MSSYLVTGGAGFIGSHLTEELLRRGEQVRVVDSLITGHRRNLAHLSGVEFVEGDLADLAVATRAVQGVDYVLHQAAIPSVPRSVEDPITSNRANIDSTLSVLVAARDARVKRVVYAGSSSAYGNTPTLPKHEEMPTNPLSPYALQKLVGEQYMQTVHSALWARDGDHPLFQRLRTAAGSVVAVLGRHLGVCEGASGKQSTHDSWRRRADTRLHVRRERRRWRAPGGNRAASVGTGHQRGDGDTHLVEPAVYVDARRYRQSIGTCIRSHTIRDVKDSLADITRARALLGYQPLVSLEEGLKKTIDWYRDGN